jgi:hypothetical protein
MLMYMQRGPYNYVTLPILAPSNWDRADGVASFLPGSGKPVRELSSEDLNPNTKRGKATWKTLSIRDRDRVIGLVALRDALEARDELAIEKACARLKTARANDLASVMRIRSLATVNLEGFGEHRMPVLDLIKPQDMVSLIVSKGLSKARLVLWWNGDRFVPALYCQNIPAALYVKAMLKFLGGRGLAVCPHCNEPFIQTRSDMDYCSVAHREAHRVARFRAKKKASTEGKRAIQEDRSTTDRGRKKR